MLAVRALRITAYMSVTFELGAFRRQGKKEIFKKIYFVCVCVLLHVCVHACWCQWMVSDLLKLIVQVLLSCQMWML